MIATSIGRVTLTAALIALAGAAHAYSINPLTDKYKRGQRPGGFWEGVSESVHEEITHAAIHCAARRAGLAPGVAPSCASIGPPTAHDPTGNKYIPLIRGVWWNDDPDQHLWSVHYATWVIWMRDAEGIAKGGRNWLGRTRTITSRYKLQYRSHYGDLQFLHAMASADGETAADVRERMMIWAEFAYAVAIRRLDVETAMEDVRYPLATRYFQEQPGWTINFLFGRRYTLGQASIPDVALGSILHMIQDSFSDAHAGRISQPSAACPQGRIAEFHAYGGQESTRHRHADTRAAWRRDAIADGRIDPVEASAQLLVFARSEADWDGVVRPYLADRVFCLDEDARPSGPGDYAPEERAARD